MSQQSQPEDTFSPVWEKSTSQNGAEYSVGRHPEEIKKREEGAGQEGDGNADFKRAFDITVDWPVGDKTWKPVSDEIRKTAAITRYRLYRNEPGSAFTYRLEFSNLEHYDYYFTDGEGDNYNNDTWLNKDHYIDYNSRNPKITHVKGS